MAAWVFVHFSGLLNLVSGLLPSDPRQDRRWLSVPIDPIFRRMPKAAA
jgi:hypothetical protein